jgi:hypothetical protein
MADQTGQNFENHVVFPKTLAIAALVMLIGVIMAAVGLFLVTSTAGTCLIGTGVVVNGCAGIFGLVVVRGYATKLQDRIIRIEMRTRLERILPPDLQADIGKLIMAQLIGLRFASDAEMPALVRKVLAENIQDRKPIKQMVQDWQGDYDRV